MQQLLCSLFLYISRIWGFKPIKSHKNEPDFKHQARFCLIQTSPAGSVAKDSIIAWQTAKSTSFAEK